MALDENLQSILNSDLNATTRFSANGKSYEEKRKHHKHEGGVSNVIGDPNMGSGQNGVAVNPSSSAPAVTPVAGTTPTEVTDSSLWANALPIFVAGTTPTPGSPIGVATVTAPTVQSPVAPNYQLIIAGIGIGAAAGYLLAGQYVKTEKLFGLKKEYAGAIAGAIVLGTAAYFIGKQISEQSGQ